MAAGLLRTIAARAVRALRTAETLAGRLSGRRVVLVEARTPMNLAVLRPVFERLLQDPRLDVRFTGVPRADLQHAFEELGIADRVLARERATWLRIDLYINADPWEAVPLRRVARQMNFFHGVAGKYDLDCPTSLPLGFDRYDRVAFPNEGRLTRYIDSGIVTAQQATLVGYPKADALAHHSGNPREAAAALGLDARRPTVIFAPTFSPASALNQAGEAIIRTLIDSGCNVIAKLHDRSLDPDPRYHGGIDWRERLAAFTNPSRFMLAASGDSTRFVLASDAMVTDHSSIGFEFCALDRPLLVFDAPGLTEIARINPEKVALLRSAAAVVRDVDSLAVAIPAALADPFALSEARRRAAGEVFYLPGGATDRALQVIYELLALAPAPHPVSRRSTEQAARFGAAANDSRSFRHAEPTS